MWSAISLPSTNQSVTCARTISAATAGRKRDRTNHRVVCVGKRGEVSHLGRTPIRVPPLSQEVVDRIARVDLNCIVGRERCSRGQLRAVREQHRKDALMNWGVSCGASPPGGEAEAHYGDERSAAPDVSVRSEPARTYETVGQAATRRVALVPSRPARRRSALVSSRPCPCPRSSQRSRSRPRDRKSVV